MTLRVGIQGSPKDRASWLQLARTVEESGFHALYAPDHPGSCASPFVALAAAAAVTERIALGTCVANAGLWEPRDLAGEVSTLDLVSEGRAVLGVGAGHTPEEWRSTGRVFPPATDRVARMIEVVEATTALLSGATTSYDGQYVKLTGARLDGPGPVRDRVPVLVGGNGRSILRFAGAHADVAGITGLGRTLADGHGHEVDWSSEALSRSIEEIRSATVGRATPCEIEALVQSVVLTDDREVAARSMLERVPGAAIEDLLSTPFVWIGSVDSIASRLVELEHRFGIGRYVVRAAEVDAAARVMEAMA